MLTKQQWFVSDTHFCSSRPQHVDAFSQLCQLPKAGDELFLLGDIFEIWIDDKLATDIDLKIEQQLKRCTERGISVYFMHGNRDFLVGNDFAKRSGCHLIKDPSTITLLDGRQAILTHGDWFCTDDANYRRYRRFVRNRFFQRCFRSLSHKRKRSIANRIRERSIQAHKTHGNRNYDANADLIQQSFKHHQPITTMIMGHTHLPNLHRHNHTERLVLGDWRDSIWYATANKTHGLRLFEADLNIEQSHCRFQSQITTNS